MTFEAASRQISIDNMVFGFLVPFIYGTLLGSFLNVCIFRLPRGTSIFLPPSACTVCKEPIRWWQNIPILSYLFLFGRCASCGSTISLRYLLIEILTGVLLAFLWRRDFPQAGLFACDLVFVSLLLVITFIDWDFQIILDPLVYFGAGVGLLCSWQGHHLLDSVLAGLAGVIFFYSIRVVGEFVFLREALGEGDVKLAGMLGAFLGSKGTAIAVFLSFPIGVIIAFGLIALGLRGRKDYIPFGPAMAVGAFISAYWGTDLIWWYLRLRFSI